MNTAAALSFAPVSPTLASGFRQGFRRNASGVWIVTAEVDGRRAGLTATSVVSLSADPAELLVSIQTNSSAYPLVRQASRFGVNLLTAEQAPLAERFTGRAGSRGEDRFTGSAWGLDCGAWLLDDALAAFSCEVVEAIDRPSNLLLIGRVLAAHCSEADAEPLVYTEGRYARPDSRPLLT